MKRKIIIIVVVLVLGAVSYAYYMYNKKTPGLENYKPDYSLTADELHQFFTEDEAAALKKYEGRVLQVSGTILSVSKTDSISNMVLNAEGALFGAVNCSFNKLEELPQKEDSVVIKGRCQGYLTSVILNNCVIVK